MKLSKDLILSVVAPMYNEEEGIQTFIQETEKVLQGLGANYEIILVNDGSKDGTLAQAKQAADKSTNIRVLDLSRNYGREIAMTAGLEAAVGDYVVLMDSDMQDPPSLIPALLDEITAKDLDVVYAARTSRAGEGALKKFTSTLFYRTARRMTGFDIPDNAGDFRIFTRQVVNSITQLDEHNRYLKMLYAYVGFRVGSIPFDRQARHAGTTSYNWVKLIGAALDAIISFSNKPLRVMSVSSVLLSLLLFVYAVFVVLQKFFSGEHIADGWTSLMLMVSLMFAILFMFLAVISEYLGRTLTESKDRPLYFVREEYGNTKFDVNHIVNNDA